MNEDDILTFWFDECSQSDWWQKSDTFDQKIRDHFASVLTQAKAGELSHWRESPRGRLAEVIVLDQFSRNIYRDDARAFEADSIALVLAQEAVRNEDDLKLTPTERAFLYMPYMHSESKKVHVEAVRLFESLGLENQLHFEKLHQDIINRFGRYPHRNKWLGRKSTSEELTFLQQPGSSF
ncbi:DUF924 family protein [Algicola sagamiensis]|uniref:DUF924 family protein n=1 Tax=Algicola sagamiensis TaxID=163869 RepID=UPI0003645159|nr:DUF924 family protein [Algicola sagamiensis]